MYIAYLTTFLITIANGIRCNYRITCTIYNIYSGIWEVVTVEKITDFRTEFEVVLPNGMTTKLFDNII